MSNARFVVASGLLIAIPISLLAQTPNARLEPVSKWMVISSDESCRLSREFGDKANPISLVFDRFEPGDYFQLTLVGSPLERFKRAGTANLQFGPNEAVQERDYLTGRANGTVPAVTLRSSMRIAPPTPQEQQAIKNKANPTDWIEIAPVGREREAAVRELRFGHKGGSQVTFALGSMKEALAVVDTCLDKMLEGWGVDVARQKAAKRLALPASSPATWIRRKDYPATALKRDEQAQVFFRMGVDASGKATSCSIQQSTSSPSFKDIVCKLLMTRAKFTPALDAEGKPFPSYFRSAVLFVTG